MTEYNPFAGFDAKPLREAREDIDRKTFIDQEQQAADVQWLMNDPRGRRLMWSWLEFCGIRRTPWAVDHGQTAFNLGVHNVGLMLEANLLKYAEAEWMLMASEAKALREKTTKQRSRKKE